MRILLVREDLVTAAAIERGLRAEGLDVDVASDGEGALWRAREGEYAAIVLDASLPKMNGYDVCRTLRSEGISTPILMSKAESGERDEIQALEVGADDFVHAPFSFPVLLARLRALLRRGQPARTPELVLGPLRFVPISRKCWVEGQEVWLTGREAGVLETLMRAGGSGVVTKATIINAVWGTGFDGDPNIVDVYIGYLRRKIDRIQNQRMLHTVRGVGYRLRAPTCLRAGNLLDDEERC